MLDGRKAKAGGCRCQNARFPTKQKWKAATLGLETTVFGYRITYTPDMFAKAYSSLVKYIRVGNLDRYGGPDAASAL